MKTTFQMLQEARKRKGKLLTKVDGVYTVPESAQRQKKLIIFQSDGTRKEVELANAC